MFKYTFIALTILITLSVVAGQSISSAVDIVTVYSQNGEFYLKTIPFDNEAPSLRGKTEVFQKDSQTPIYSFQRGFDSVDSDSNNLFLSNDGKNIFYVIPWSAEENVEGLGSITIYENGKIVKSFTKAEITKCDLDKERCDLIYSNFNEVVDRKKSNAGTRNYKKAFKDGVSEKEKFLSNFPIFSYNDIVYLTDSKKNTHIFDLNKADYVETKSFDSIYEQIESKGRFNEVELQRLDVPIVFDIPKLKNGIDTYEGLAKYIGMKSVDIYDKKSEQFKRYSFRINLSLNRDGSMEIEEADIQKDLPEEKIIEFFRTNKFDSNSIPEAVEKWYLGEKIFFLRKADDKLARQEKQEEIAEYKKIAEKNMTAEKINDVYIPKDLGEAFAELDKLLNDVNKKEMQTLPKREDMIEYHLGLGMWMRNNWHLWDVSRLKQYFLNRGVSHPDDMSSVILYQYYDWLNGDKESWKTWDKNALNKTKQK